MYLHNIYEPARFADLPSFHDRPLASARSPHEATFQLTRRATLTVLLALSLGLWAAIWAALASLASAVFG